MAEDPVTGSLNAALVHWLIGAALTHERYRASQGMARGRAGRVHVQCNALGLVGIGSETVGCVEGTVRLWRLWLHQRLQRIRAPLVVR